jgi:hypothetical protein
MSDGVRPDILRREQNREQQTGDKSREPPGAPVILQDRVTQDYMAASHAVSCLLFFFSFLLN